MAFPTFNYFSASSPFGGGRMGGEIHRQDTVLWRSLLVKLSHIVRIFLLPEKVMDGYRLSRILATALATDLNEIID